MLTIIIAGIVTGSVYALAAIGLVLTYKTSGIFNFAQGALATVAAYAFYSMYVQASVPWWIAAAVCVLVIGPILGLCFEMMARTLSTASFAVKTVSTVGVLLVVQGAALLIYGSINDRVVPQYLPDGGFAVGETPVELADVIVVVVAFVATATLYLFFRYARTGVAMRALVDNPDLVDLAGTNPNAVRRWAWVIGISFASASGVLLAPLLSVLNATTLTLLVVQAFGAAAIGGFSSLPRTYVGGLVIGVAAAVATKEFTTGLLAGLPAALPFLVLFGVLLVSPKATLGVESVLRPPSRSSWVTPWPFQVLLGVVLLVVLLLVPSFASFHLTDWTLFLTTTMLFLSLGLLVKTSGQVSLCHVAFAAIGASAMSHLTMDHGWPWFVALVAAGVVAVPIGALLAIPAIRLSGLYLALATFGFGILLAFMFYTEPYMFGASGAGLTLPRPSVPFVDAQTDEGYYYVVLVLMLVVTVGVVALNRSRLGRLLRALSDSPIGLATTGTSINVTRVLVFCVSAFIAALAGAIAGVAQQAITGDAYGPLVSLTYFAIVIISVGGTPWYALLGAAGFALIPSYFPSADTSSYLTVLFGVFALMYAMTPEDLRGAPPAVARFFDGLADRLPWYIRRKERLAHAPEEARVIRDRVAPARLEVEGLRVQFGGLVAVDGVRFAVETGQIVGLIGPNGAGKTTTFDAVCGLNRPGKGSVTLDGRDIVKLGAAARARRGLGRTFQQMQLFDTLTVQQNVSLGAEGGFAGPDPLRHLLSAPGQRHRVAAVAREAMETCGITQLSDRVVGGLSTGQRRLVELARTLAGTHRLLLLDEPSSGLDRVETERFGEILKRVVADRGVGILIVEHDMALVRDVCDYLYVLDFGKPIYEGEVHEALRSPVVQAAYLGGEEVEAAVAAMEATS